MTFSCGLAICARKGIDGCKLRIQSCRCEFSDAPRSFRRSRCTRSRNFRGVRCEFDARSSGVRPLLSWSVISWNNLDNCSCNIVAAEFSVALRPEMNAKTAEIFEFISALFTLRLLLNANFIVEVCVRLFVGSFRDKLIESFFTK